MHPTTKGEFMSLSDAVQAAELLGRPVFPCNPLNKRPLIKDWPNQASRDPETIESMWRDHPNAMVGIVTGDWLLVVDLDPKHGESLGDMWQTLRDRYGLPDSAIVQTQSGGWHIYLRMDQTRWHIRNSSGLLGPGVDIRANGGYVIGPGSQTVAGKRYELLDAEGWEDAEILPAPVPLLEALEPLTPYERSSSGLIAADTGPGAAAQVMEGGRNHYLTRWAGKLRASGLSVSELVAALAQINAERCRPPLPPYEVERIAQSAGRWERGEDVPTEGAPVDPVAIRWELGAELADTCRAPQWLIRGVLEADSVGVLFGDSMTYKTFLVLDMVAHIAAGSPWHGHEVVRPGPAFLIVGEGQGGISRRIKALYQHRPHLRDGALYVLRVPQALIDDANAGAIAESIAQATTEAPACIVVDTLSQNAGGDENDNTDMAALLANCRAYLANRFGCAVMLVHHVGHADKERTRGAYTLLGNTDWQMRTSREGDEVTLSSVKAKDAEPFAPMVFAADQVTLEGLEDGGEPVSSLVVNFLRQADPSDKPKKPLTRAEKIALDAILAVLRESPTYPPKDAISHRNGARPGQKGVSGGAVRAWIGQHGGLSDSDKPDTESKAQRRAIKSLQMRGIIGIFEDFIWIADNPDKSGQF